MKSPVSIIRGWIGRNPTRAIHEFVIFDKRNSK